MNKGQEYIARKTYVEKVLGAALKPMKDFAYIKYARTGLTEGEYVRISDTLGRAITLDITGMPLALVLNEIASIILAGKNKAPYTVITDTKKLREISPLFK